MSTSASEAILSRLEAGDFLSTDEMMNYRRQPGAILALIAGMRQAKPGVRRNGVDLLADLGRVMLPPEGIAPERPGPIVDHPEVISYLVELLGDSDREVRREACTALATLVPESFIRTHAAAILDHLKRNPSTDGAIVLLGKTGLKEALDLLKTKPEFYKVSPQDAEMARARLGDDKASDAVIAAYTLAPDSRAKAIQVRRLGYIGTDRAVRLLAHDIRTSETYIWSGRAKRSFRIHIIEALHLAFLTEPVFWPPLFPPRSDAYYEKIEQWLTAKLGVTWKNPRPPFLYQQDSPTPPMESSGPKPPMESSGPKSK